MATRIRAQIHMEDNIVNNPELEAGLEERQVLKESVSDFRKVDKRAKAKIQEVQTPLPYRVGRFIIARQTVAAKSIAYETSEGARITIKTVDE